MFSIVIPLYNKELEIRKTLESVLKQTFRDFEVLIINDGSTDKSVEVVSEFIDKRIRLINKSNGGVSSARNDGIKAAKFEWIAFLDADDLWEETKLDKVATVINNNPDVWWIFSGFQSVKGVKKYNRTYSYNGVIDDALDALNKGLAIQTSTVVIKKKAFLLDDKLYFPIGINNSEDREIWYRLIFRYPNPYYIQEVLSYYIIDELGNSLNTNKSGTVNFLELGIRLANDYHMLTLERKEKFSTFLKNFNSRGCWGIWVRAGWRPEFEGYVSKTDQSIMLSLSKLPRSIKNLIFKLRKRTLK